MIEKGSEAVQRSVEVRYEAGREGDDDADGPGLEAERMHDTGGYDDHGGRAQRFGRIIHLRNHPAALGDQDLMQVPVPMRPNIPIVQMAAGGDGLDMHETLVGRLKRFSV